ncbi:hypothetical protein SAMN05444481_13523 [Flavobacterium frigidimaris]|nr:hypothetical protein SAMN05444481_13523 [Flavobacterium frigidimaris]
MKIILDSIEMNRKGIIIIIEDDQDDQEILKEVLDKLSHPNKILFF